MFSAFRLLFANNTSWIDIVLIKSSSVGLKSVGPSKKFCLNGSSSNIPQIRFYWGPYVGLLCIASRGNAWGWFRCTAELYRALINALVQGSTYWSHCLNAYSFNAVNIAGKPQFIYRMIDVHLQWDTRPPTHPWTATLLCYTGRQYVSWLWLNCHNAFNLRCLKQCLFWLPFKVLKETNYPVNNVVLPGTACTLGIYRLNHQPS